MKIFGIAGFKNSGKTTLVVELVQEFCKRGLRAGTIKHAHHNFDIDHPGKDSYAHRQAGANEVIVASANRWAHISELRTAKEPSLEELISKFGDLDIVLIEGYKHGKHPKLELRRQGISPLGAAGVDPNVVAIVTDESDANEVVPVLARDNVPAVADFVLANASEA